jgi:hypothetical protein
MAKEVGKIIDPIIDSLKGFVDKYGKWIVILVIVSIIYRHYKNK